MKRTNKHHFRDILTYAKFSLSFVDNMDYKSFVNDTKSVFAVIRTLEVIGESSNRVSHEIKSKYPALPWHKMRGMRNRIVHNYDNIDYMIIWNVIENEIPELIKQIELIIDEIE